MKRLTTGPAPTPKLNEAKEKVSSEQDILIGSSKKWEKGFKSNHDWKELKLWEKSFGKLKIDLRETEQNK